MAAAKWKEKAELVECVASARRKARFARSAKTVAASTRAREMVAAELKRASSRTASKQPAHAGSRSRSINSPPGVPGVHMHRGSPMPDFANMDRSELSKWYVENVGYDIGAEDPEMSLEEYRELCEELHEGHSEAAD